MERRPQRREGRGIDGERRAERRSVQFRDAIRRHAGHESGRTRGRGARGLLLDGSVRRTREGRLSAERIETKATLNFDKTEAGWTVKSIHLDVTAKVPGADPAKFQAAANAAEKGCPISRLLKAEITMSARLV